MAKERKLFVNVRLTKKSREKSSGSSTEEGNSWGKRFVILTVRIFQTAASIFST
jgi:hypothetical protein